MRLVRLWQVVNVGLSTFIFFVATNDINTSIYISILDLYREIENQNIQRHQPREVSRIF